MEDDNTTIVDTTVTTYRITFTLLLIVEIPSIVCTLLIIIYCLFHWHSMVTKSLHNHAILLLIVVSLLYITLDLPFTISSKRLGYDRFRTPSFCLWWYWIDYTLLSTSLSLTAVAGIQGHILIFNNHWLRIRRTRWLLHFIPLIICTLYPAFFYLVFIYLYPCKSLYDEESLTCPEACYYNNIILFSVDWITNYISPVCIIVLANITLICRVMFSMHKLHRRQSNTWKRQSKLSLQLLSLSSLYALGWTPATCVSLIQMYFLPNLYDDLPELYYIYDSTYFVCPLQSFICLFALPDVIKCIKTYAKRLLSRSTGTTVVAFVVTP